MYNFIVNPSSASGNAAKIWSKVSQILAKKEITYNAYLTKGTGDATAYAQKICDSEDNPTIIVLGGDGTVNEVVTGIPDLNKVVFGYIPSGSSNDLARDLDLDTDPQEALEKILNPTSTIMLDIGKVVVGKEERSFAVSCGVGYDAAICYEAMHSNIKRVLNRFHMGKFTYVLLALIRLFKAPKLDAVITLDNNEELKLKKFIFAAVMNHRYEGGGCMFCPDAAYDDRVLDVCAAAGISKLRVLRILPTAYTGGHTKFKGIYVKKAKQIEIVPSKPTYIHTDGEFISVNTKAVISLREGQLKMIYK